MQRRFLPSLLLILLLGACTGADVLCQSNTTEFSPSWKLSGKVQLQHLWDPDQNEALALTDHGFRIRRGRLKVIGFITEWADVRLQMEVRDDKPKLKDAICNIKIFDDYFLRLGQFKVPMWREELRSSSRLLLVERSDAAEFLSDHLLSARHIGVEIGGKYANGLHFALNFSNGAGEGQREDAGVSVDDNTNDGKMLSGRLAMDFSPNFSVGLSGSANVFDATYTKTSLLTASDSLRIDTIRQNGTLVAVAPDFRWLHKLSDKSQIEVESGIAIGSVPADLALNSSGMRSNFVLYDVGGRWTIGMDSPLSAIGGFSAIEIAAGFSYIEPNQDVADDERFIYRVGPAFHFGKKVRLQVNGEWTIFASPLSESQVFVRSQASFSF